VRRQQRRVEIDRHALWRAGQLPKPGAGAGVRAAQPADRVRIAGDLIDHPKRRRIRRHAAEQRGLITHRREVRKAIAAVSEHHRQIAHDTAAVMAAGSQPQIRQLARQRPRQAGLVGDLREQRAAGVRPQALSVRRDFYGYPAPIVRHLQGDPSRVGLQALDKPKNPCSGGRQSGPGHRGRRCFMHDPG
jgi:hypothetical protein